MNTLTDVHTFDGKIENNFKPQFSLDKIQKKEMFEKLSTKFENPMSRMALKVIINDLDGPMNNNYDNINKMDASDILGDICSSKDLENVREFLEEQLKDALMLGFCPQGRAIRLYQIWKGITF